MNAAQSLAPVVEALGVAHLGITLQFWDGSALGPAEGAVRILVRSSRAISRLLAAPGELGLARAYVAGDLDVEPDVEALLALAEDPPRLRIGRDTIRQIVRAAIATGAWRTPYLPPPPEEARLRGPLHSRERDAAAIAHHYDVGNDFYRLMLGPSMTYSCAYFASPDTTLEDAQRDKIALICRKLGLVAGQRLLDVGCGWGTLAIQAARDHGVHVVGVTLSAAQAEFARKRAADEGVLDRVEVRVQDERDVDDGPYDAISSVGMFEHVGRERLGAYFRHLRALLGPQGRLLNHGIARAARPGTRDRRIGAFIDRYVFPDGELHKIGDVVWSMQESGFEIRHVEGLREHYGLTLRRWIANLDARRHEAVALAGEGRYRVWRLYTAGSARGFESGRLEVHQVLGVRADGGRSGMPLRPFVS